MLFWTINIAKQAPADGMSSMIIARLMFSFMFWFVMDLLIINKPIVIIVSPRIRANSQSGMVNNCLSNSSIGLIPYFM